MDTVYCKLLRYRRFHATRMLHRSAVVSRHRVAYVAIRRRSPPGHGVSMRRLPSGPRDTAADWRRVREPASRTSGGGGVAADDVTVRDFADGRADSRRATCRYAPPHLKCVATLPCNLSLMACFANISVSQGSVATYARCARTFNIRLTANLLRNLPVKNCKWVKI